MRNFRAVKASRFLLLPFAGLYGIGIAVRNLAYDQGWNKRYAVGVPVISVGNITAGGTGKTPMAEFLLEKLQVMGRHPAYLSRGYGRSTQGYLRVDPEQAGGLRFGDEAVQVARRFPKLPVAVCEDRVEGARRLIAEDGADVIVLDDAFQHRRIARDLDLVMIDANRPPWRDHLLPAGRLREPRRSLRRAHAFIVSKWPAAMAPEMAAQTVPPALRPDTAVSVFGLEAVEVCAFAGEKKLPLSELKRYTGIAFAGLGNNAYFFRQVARWLGDCSGTTGFRDHHVYTAGDREKILAQLRDREEKNNAKFDGPIILTTEKDYMRLRSTAGFTAWQTLPLYYVRVRLRPVWGERAFTQKIEETLKKYGKDQ